jgi:peptide/nickel transport system substrate-binding protein
VLASFVFPSMTQDLRPPVLNQGSVADKEVSDLLKKAAATVNPEERAPMYRQAEQMIHDKVLRIFIAHNQPTLAFPKQVSGFVPNPTSAEYFNTVSLAK